MDALELPEAGSVLSLRQADVYLGNEDLTLRLRSINGDRPVHYGQEWVQVEGTALTDEGEDRGYRSALVRVRALQTP